MEVSGIAFIGPTRYWAELDVDQRRLQAKALDAYRRYEPILGALLQGQPPELTDRAKEAHQTLAEILEQGGSTWYRTGQEAVDAAGRALDTQLELLSFLDGGGADDEVIMVPDTNALLRRPELDEWTFGAGRFTLLLLPQVLRELDEQKMRATRPELRETAESVIRRIKDLAGRGSLQAGVTLRRDKSTVRSIATEPNMEETLEWLDPTSGDDRIIAGMIDAMRRFPRSTVVLVTTDVNLQNKAAFAALPFVEPPAPAGGGQS
jgi:hypothetical protein